MLQDSLGHCGGFLCPPKYMFFLLKINVLQHHDGLDIKETNLGKSFDNYTTKLAATWDLQKLAKQQQTSKTTWQICEQMG